MASPVSDGTTLHVEDPPGAIGAGGVAGLLTAVALFATFGLLPAAWTYAELSTAERALPASAGLMALAVVAGRGHLGLTRGTGLAMLAFLALYPVLCWLSYLVNSGPSADKERLLVQTAQVTALCAIYHCFGYATAGTLRRTALLGLLGALVAYAFANVESFRATEQYLNALETGRELNYQYLGDSLAMLAIVAFTRIRNPVRAAALAVVAIVALMIVPSRSSAVLGSAVLGLGILLRASDGRSRVPLVLGLLAFATVATWYGSGAGDARWMAEWFADTRLESLFAPSEDSSAQARLALTSAGMQTIAARPLLGTFQFQLDRFGDSGLYVHSLLDAWAQGGVLAFLLIVLYLARLAQRALARGLQDPVHARTALLLLAFAIGSWIAARSTLTTWLFFATGHALASVDRGDAIRRALRTGRPATGQRP